MFALGLAGAERDELARKLELSRAAISRGDYAKAIQVAGEAAELARRAGDVGLEGAAVNQRGLGHLYRAEYPQALAAFESAIELNRRAGNAEAEVTAGNNAGNVHFFQGRYSAALEAYEAALQKTRNAVGQPWSRRRLQLTLVNLGVLYEQLGQNERALEHYRQADLSPTSLPPAEQAQLLSNLGTVYRRLEDPVRALETYREAQTWFERGKHHDGEIHVLHNIGIVMAQNFRDVPRALDAFNQAVQLARRSGNRRQETLGYLFRAETLFRASRIDEANKDYALALAGARQAGAAEEQWTAQFGLGRVSERRGASVEALSWFRQAISTIEGMRSGLRRSLKANFLADKREVYDAAIRILLDSPARDAAVLFTLIEHARARNLQDTLGQAPPADPAVVQARLPERVLLAEYWAGPDRAAVLWMTRHQRGILELPVRELSAFAGAAADLAGAKQDWRDWSRSAGRLLLDRLPLAEVDTMWIAPDGPLYRIPFEALASGDRLLIERCVVQYLPSASLLMRDSRPQPIAPPWRPQVAAFGDPLTDTPGRLEPDTGWTRLPFAAEELKLIGRALPGAARTYAGKDNLKARLDDRNSAPPVLHFATHAALDLSDANRSRILFTPDPARPGSQYLFRSEVEALDLHGIDLVTLSACDTEGGRLIRGEGVMSFSRAFLAAGANATVTTLWKVPDQPTSEFMRLFYAALGRRQGKAAALRSAKLSFLRSRAGLDHPRFWAAFVLNGNGAAPLPPVVSWSSILAAAAVVLLVAAFVSRWKRLRRQLDEPRP